MRRVVVLTMVLSASVAGGLWADEGRIPIFRATTITEPGHYVVTRNILSPGPALDIQSADVVVDLNGHTLTVGAGPITTCDDVFFVIQASRGPVTVRNGTVLGCNGISGVTRIEGVTLHAAYTGIENASEVVRSNIRADDGYAITTTGLTVRIADNLIANSDSGIFLSGAENAQVLRNVIRAPSTTNCNFGIRLVGGRFNVVEGNTIIVGSSCSGIVTGSSDTRVAVNVVTAPSGVGIEVSGSRNRILDNLVNEGGDGIGIVGTAAAFNHLEGNQVQGNDCGIRIGNGNSNSYRNNVGGSNLQTGALCISSGNVNLGGNSGV